MNTEVECTLAMDPTDKSASTADAPSVDFIHAVSEFLDTDPKDLLVELGYYRENAETAGSK